MTILQGIISSVVPANEVLSTGIVNSLGINTIATITSYINSSGERKRINNIIASGTGYSKYTIVLNTVIIATGRTGPGRNIEFFLNIDIDDGSIIDIKAEHFTTGDTQNYEATILGY